MTTRLANALQRHRHLEGARVLCQKNGQPLRANMLAYLLERATRKAGLATGRKLRHAGPHVLRQTFCSHLAMPGARWRDRQDRTDFRKRALRQLSLGKLPFACESEQASACALRAAVDNLRWLPTVVSRVSCASVSEGW